MEGSGTAIRILRTMLDPNTPEGERENALRACCRIMKTHGLSSYQLVRNEIGDQAFLSGDHYNGGMTPRTSELQAQLTEALATIEQKEDEIRRLTAEKERIERLGQTKSQSMTPERFLRAAKKIALHDGFREQEWAKVMAGLLTDPKDPSRHKRELTVKQMTRNPLAKVASQVEEELRKRNLTVE